MISLETTDNNRIIGINYFFRMYDNSIVFCTEIVIAFFVTCVSEVKNNRMVEKIKKLFVTVLNCLLNSFKISYLNNLSFLLKDEGIIHL